MVVLRLGRARVLRWTAKHQHLQSLHCRATRWIAVATSTGLQGSEQNTLHYHTLHLKFCRVTIHLMVHCRKLRALNMSNCQFVYDASLTTVNDRGKHSGGPGLLEVVDVPEEGDEPALPYCVVGAVAPQHGQMSYLVQTCM
jgi:hypothetical protein